MMTSRDLRGITLPLLLSIPAIGLVVVVGLGAISPVDYALGVLVMTLLMLAVDVAEGMR